MRSIHAALVARDPAVALHRLPIYHHWEDEELGVAPLYELLSIPAAPGGIRAYCRSSREGTAIELWFSAYYDARDRLGARALIFDAADRATLRAAGLRGASSWSGRWSPDRAPAVIAAFEALEGLRPRVLLPEDLPPGAPWPWPSLIFLGLYADAVEVAIEGAGRSIDARLDGERHHLREPHGDRWDALWRAWQAGPPALRPYAEWLRGRDLGEG